VPRCAIDLFADYCRQDAPKCLPVIASSNQEQPVHHMALIDQCMLAPAGKECVCECVCVCVCICLENRVDGCKIGEAGLADFQYLIHSSCCGY
jgi:hypothetical protein